MKIEHSLVFTAFLFVFVSAVDRSNFKTCAQSGFCKYQREYKPDVTPYHVDKASITKDDYKFSCIIRRSDIADELILTLEHMTSSVFRLKIDEMSESSPRFTIPEGDVVLKDLAMSKLIYMVGDTGILVYGGGEADKVSIQFNPFSVEIFKNGASIIVLNGDHLLNMQTQNAAQIEKLAANDTAGPDWKETFKSHTDSKKNGPRSIGLDVSFLNTEHVFGIPEHADSFLLRDTDSTDPYRLYNLDVFAYELQETMALYGSVPFMFAHSQNGSFGIFWNNPTETWIDITSSRSSNTGLLSSFFSSKSNDRKFVRSHWMSEAGIIDLFLLLGPTPRDVSAQYASITGTTPLPPLFALAYHQCRWNYKDQADILSLDQNFDKYKIPADVLWLDIEHTNGKRYFTWDQEKFPNPGLMVDRLLEKQRKLVTVVDPHIKSDHDWEIYKKGQELGIYVKDANGGEYSGWCWPGSSAYPDFTAEQTRDWWSKQFLHYEPVRTNTMFSWNDMGEPSVFSGPEVSMPKDVIHLNGFEHRDVHNLYGMYIHQATWEGQLLRAQHKMRPFVLTRAFFAGSQRTSAVWTGDNAAEWSHLKITIPMLLSLSVSGVTFCGADVGGFFNNPDQELLTRWYQAGAYQPFFRAHAHLDTARREPWLFPEETTNRIRAAIEQRYALLPYWYTLFALAEFSGEPPMAPLWYHFPKQTELYAYETAYMLGEAMLISPVLDHGASSVQVTLPAEATWYQFPDFKVYKGGEDVTVPVTIDDIPVFYRGGYIVPRRERMRRTSMLMAHDPYTLFVLVSQHSNEAQGYIYEDDNETINDEDRLLLKTSFKLHGKTAELKLVSPSKHPLTGKVKSRATGIERILVVGLKDNIVHCQRLKNGKEAVDVPCVFEPAKDGRASLLEIKRPDINLSTDWTLLMSPTPSKERSEL